MYARSWTCKYVSVRDKLSLQLYLHVYESILYLFAPAVEITCTPYLALTPGRTSGKNAVFLNVFGWFMLTGRKVAWSFHFMRNCILYSGGTDMRRFHRPLTQGKLLKANTHNMMFLFLQFNTFPSIVVSCSCSHKTFLFIIYYRL